MANEEIQTTDGNILARVDERTKSIQNEIGHLREEIKQSVATLSVDIKDTENRQTSKNNDIEKQFVEIRLDLDKNYIKKGQFNPVQYVVYGLVGLILTSVVTAFIATIIHSTTAVQIVGH